MKHAGTQTIETERLTLRRFKITDAEVMFRNWANDDEVTLYMRWATHKEVEESKSVMQQWIDSYEKDSSYHWGICLKDGEIIGSIGAFVDEIDYNADIGYCIGRKWWNKGYTSEALKALIDFMFTNTDIERLGAYHAAKNVASGKVMQKAGMVHEGFARHKFKSREGFQDSDLYAIIREMWEEQKILEVQHENH